MPGRCRARPLSSELGGPVRSGPGLTPSEQTSSGTAMSTAALRTLAPDATSGSSVADVSSPAMIGIGAAARALGTTERTLRYYEQRGLLTPARLSAGEHRQYDEPALRRARRVLALRELGLSLDVIASILTGEGSDELSTVLRAQAAKLDNEADELDALRHRISRLLAAPARLDETLNLLEDLAVKIVLSRIYTRTGDDGTTALADRARVDKTDARLEVMGDVDELISALGVAIAAAHDEDRGHLLRSIQNDLFDLGADLASAGIGDAAARSPLVDDAYIERLEQTCDQLNAGLTPPASFVLPGSNAVSAAVHHARAICRRAERHAWAASDTADEDRRYLNRLSDLLFILARATETAAEPTWGRSHQPTYQR